MENSDFKSSDTQKHSAEFQGLLDGLTRPKNKGKDLWENIDNVVFQGGGVLGVAYLGVLKRFEEEKFLDKIKRVAGTSAGSLVSLYLGLKMDYKSIVELMSINYADLLDEDIYLNVIANPRSVILPYWPVKRSMKDIILSATYLFSEIETLVQKKDTIKAEERITELVDDVVKYFTYYVKGWLKTVFNVGAWFTSRQFVEMAVKSLFEMITPKSTDPNKYSSSYGNWFTSNNEGNKFCATHVMQCATGHNYAHIDDDRNPNLQPPKITGTQLHYSIAQLIWFMLFDQVSAEERKVDLGLFTASIVRERLIEAPIRNKLKKFGISNSNPTFAELNSYEDDDKNKLFRPFYVTAFNTSTLRTEVFSAEHTPNVVVADAVRASMSIPVFFTAVNIQEKNPDGSLVNRVIHYQEEERGKVKTADIRYMDGGVFDNYPLWMFDDLKYCVSKDTFKQLNVQKRTIIENPRTLGFKFIGKSRMNIYLKPYYDENRTQMKRVSCLNYSGDFPYIASTMVQAEIQEHEESSFMNQGYWARTGYIYNHSISAIAFNLTEEQKDDLIESGEKAVNEYFERAEKNFEGEGLKYPKSD